MGIVAVKKPRFGGLENLYIPNIGRELIPDPGVVHTFKKNLCLKILALHLFGIIVGESDDLKEIVSVPRKFTLSCNEIKDKPYKPLNSRILSLSLRRSSGLGVEFF